MNRREFAKTSAGALAGMGLASLNLSDEERRTCVIKARKADPAILMSHLGLTPDPWQKQVLRSRDKRRQILCCRQAGKSTTTAVLALHTALYDAGSLTLLLSPSIRQSSELFKKIAGFYRQLGRPVTSVQETALTLTLENESRIVSLPGTPETIRGFSDPRLVVIDEAAMTSDALFVAVSPMLAMGGGQLVCLSTPLGKRGWFFEQWEGQDSLWSRTKIKAWDCPRISQEFLEEQRRLLSPRHFRQEYECSFEEACGQVFSSDAIGAAFDPEFAGFGYEGVA